EQHSVRDFVEAAGRELGMRITWQGKDAEERGIDAKTGHTVVRLDPRYLRPAEVNTLLGDASKARAQLGWQPTVSFGQLVTEMVAHDLSLAERDAALAQRGFRVAQQRE